MNPNYVLIEHALQVLLLLFALLLPLAVAALVHAWSQAHRSSSRVAHKLAVWFDTL